MQRLTVNPIERRFVKVAFLPKNTNCNTFYKSLYKLFTKHAVKKA